ncbi:MAG: hypothetical protein M1470_05595 [Bacteroidetes bacterium]|nr:hypothetical protein [Bacteroidota bacterium]MCL5737254.1 hypothetical protein [Bacteroidota bacterium]
MESRISAVLFFLAFVSVNAYAQFPSDALRLGQSGYGVSARSIAMGNAEIGLSQGFDATFFNPAGLAQSRQSQISMGLNFLGYNDNATYLGTNSSSSSSQTDLSNLGLVYPFPTVRGSFVVAFGYNRGNDFNTALSFNGFNPYSSIIPSLYANNVKYDIPFNVGLEDTLGNIIVNKNVGQSGIVYESGGLNNWLAAGAMDIGPDFSIGLTLNLISGSYKYTRQFTETDPQGFYRGRLSDMSGAVGLGSFVLNDEVDQTLNGWNAKGGFMYRLTDESGRVLGRFGATITFPSFITVNEKYSDKGTATYLTGLVVPYTTPGGSSNYDVTTPFKFGFGASGGTSQLTLAADVEYVDWTQLQFGSSNLPSDFINSLNAQIKQEYRATTSFRGGLELALTNPEYSLFVPFIRLGGGYFPSPYKGDGPDRAQKYLSGGVGVKLQNSIDLDVAYQYGWWNTIHQQYDKYSVTNEKVTNTNFVFTFKYNF